MSDNGSKRIKARELRAGNILGNGDVVEYIYTSDNFMLIRMEGDPQPKSMNQHDYVVVITTNDGF